MSYGSFLHVNANTLAAGLTVNPNGGAILKSVVINTVGATGNTLTLYDGQGTAAPARVIGVVNTTNAAVPSLDYNVVCPSGIWYTLLTGTAADLTIIFQ